MDAIPIPPPIADYIIAALQKAAATGRLAPPWQETTEDGLWYASRMLPSEVNALHRGMKYAGYTMIVDSEAIMRERMATGDDSLRAAGYLLTEDVVREAVASHGRDVVARFQASGVSADLFAGFERQVTVAQAETARLWKLAADLLAKLPKCDKRKDDGTMCLQPATTEEDGARFSGYMACDAHPDAAGSKPDILPWAEEVRALVAALAEPSTSAASPSPLAP